MREAPTIKFEVRNLLSALESCGLLPSCSLKEIVVLVRFHSVVIRLTARGVRVDRFYVLGFAAVIVGDLMGLHYYHVPHDRAP